MLSFYRNNEIGDLQDRIVTCKTQTSGASNSGCCLSDIDQNYPATDDLPCNWPMMFAEQSLYIERSVAASSNRQSSSRILMKRNRSCNPPAAVVDVAYVRRVLRKHRDADRRAAASVHTCVPSPNLASEQYPQISASPASLSPSPASLTYTHTSSQLINCCDPDSDRHSSVYESDFGSSSECSSGCWDKTTWPLEKIATEAVVCDDSWLDELRSVETEHIDPWVADWM